MKVIDKSDQIVDLKKSSKGFNIKKLQNLIETGLPSISQQLDQAVLVLGNTGSGKSTLINGLIGKKLIAVLDEKDKKIVKLELAEGEKGAKIGDTLVSETTVPQYWINKETNVGYFDCPGFADNKGAEQDIANAVFIQQLFTITKQVKIVIVAPQAQFDLNNERAGPVLKFINQIADLFPNIDEVSQSICLVVTKAKDIYDEGELIEKITPESIKKDLLKLKEDHSKSEESQYFKDKSDSFTRIFDNLLLAENKIQIFKTPLRKEASKREYIEVPKEVIEMIDLIPYVKVSKINPPISKDSYEKISIFYSELQEYAKEQGQKLVSYTKKSLDPKNLQGTFKILELVNEINNVKKFFDLRSINNKEEFSDVSSHYAKMIESLCNMVEFKNETNIADEMGWMGHEKMQERLKEMSHSEIEALLNRNPFVFILKSIEFISNIKPPQSHMSDFLHVSIDEIRNSIFEEINKLKSGLIETFNKSVIEIKEVINEFLKNNQNENEIERLDESLKQAISLNDKYLDEYVGVLKKSITISNLDMEGKLSQLKHKYLDILRAYQSDPSSFPVYTVKSSLGSSFSETQTRLNYLRKRMIEEAQLKIKNLDQAIMDTKDEQEKMKLKAEKEKVAMSEKISLQALQLNSLTKDCNIQQYMKDFIREKNELWGQDCKNYIKSSVLCDWNNPHQCVRGEVVYLNEVMELTKQKNANKDKFDRDTKHFFVVYASKEISVKSNVNITYKGGNIVLVAPIIDVNAELNIDLSGIDGIGSTHKATSGTWNPNNEVGKHGSNGNNGESGKPGGNIIMIAQEYKGLDQNLRININGGNGGDGQDGGNGGSCNHSYLFRPAHRHGGNGGDGGFAGAGAEAGSVKIFKFKHNITTNVKNVIIQNNGNDGKIGEGGKGGLGWKSYYPESSGQNGSNGQTGKVANKISKDPKIESVMNYDYVKNDYIKFMTNYAPEALNHPSDYIDISGHATDYDSFL